MNIFPNGDYVKLTDDPVQWLKHLILPWTALSVLFIGFYSRVLRSNILDTINEDYVRTARAKGLSGARVIVRHVVRNSLIPIISLWGLDFAAIIGGGAIITEKAFNLPGVGAFAANSIGQLDVPPVLVVMMLGAFFVVLLQRRRRRPLRVARPADPADGMTSDHLLDVEDLRVSFRTEDGVVQAVDDVSFTLEPGEVLAVVGESGSGKSVTRHDADGPHALDQRAHRGVGACSTASELLTAWRRRSCGGSAGEEIAMIFQDPMTALNPVHRVGDQIVEQIRAHSK